MWATLALTAAMSALPAQNGQVRLANARFTYGILGEERKDTAFIPGDVAVLTFDIEGLKVAPDGGVRFSLGFEMTSKEKNGQTKSWYKKDPEEIAVTNTLGKGRRTEYVTANVGVENKPGEYTITVVVKDVAAGGQAATLQRNFTVKPPQFGIIQPNFMYLDMNAREPSPPQPAPPLSVPGKHMMLRFHVIGFTLKDDAQEPNVAVKMEVRDDKDQPVLGERGKPFASDVKQIREEFKKLNVIPFILPIQVTRPGKFKVVITVVDQNAGNKKATLSLNLRVVDLEK